jgi:hypothetical protein
MYPTPVVPVLPRGGRQVFQRVVSSEVHNKYRNAVAAIRFVRGPARTEESQDHTPEDLQMGSRNPLCVS